MLLGLLVAASVVHSVVSYQPYLRSGTKVSRSVECGHMSSRTACIAATMPLFSGNSCSSWKCSSESIEWLSSGCCVSPVTTDDAWRLVNDTSVMFVGHHSESNAVALLSLLSPDAVVTLNPSFTSENTLDTDIYAPEHAATVLASSVESITDVLSDLRRSQSSPSFETLHKRARSIVMLSLGPKDFEDPWSNSVTDHNFNVALFVERVLSTVSLMKSHAILRTGIDTLIVQLPAAVPWPVRQTQSKGFHEHLATVSSIVRMAMEGVHPGVGIVDMSWMASLPAACLRDREEERVHSDDDWPSVASSHPTATVAHASLSQLLHAVKLLTCDRQ
jgi:hypothetical protein